MSLPTKHVWIGLFLGASATMIGPGWAIDLVPDTKSHTLDADNLVRFDGRSYELDYGPEVSTEPIRSHSVRKIGYGRESQVDIVETSSGTYSSEGLFSPHIRYPGISVKPAADRFSSGFHILSMSNGHWVAIGGEAASSIVALRGQGGSILTLGNGTTCISTRVYHGCQ